VSVEAVSERRWGLGLDDLSIDGEGFVHWIGSDVGSAIESSNENRSMQGEGR